MHKIAIIFPGANHIQDYEEAFKIFFFITVYIITVFSLSQITILQSK